MAKVCFEVALKLFCNEQPIAFAPLPAVLRQLVLLNHDSLNEKNKVFAHLEHLLTHYGPQMQATYSPAEAEFVIAMSFNQGVQLFRINQFQAAESWMSRALKIHDTLLPGAFANKRDKMQHSHTFVVAKLTEAMPS